MDEMRSSKKNSVKEDIVYIATTNTTRSRVRRFGVKLSDRRFHTYMVGKTGTGKSTLLKTMILQDVKAGRGLALLDPHGDLVEEVLQGIPESQLPDIVHLDTPNRNWTFNPLAGVQPGEEALAVAELVEVFRKLWISDWGPRLEHLLRNVLFTLFEIPRATLQDAMRLISEREYRDRVVRGLRNIEVKMFWQKEFALYSPAFRAVVVAPLQNKLGALLTDPRMKAIITAKESSFNLRDVMDEGKVLLVNLSRGRIGEGPAMMLGALLAARIGLAGLSRADTTESDRRDFYLYLDEFQMFATESLATMLAELRKYRVSLILAHQYMGQLDRSVRDAVLGNAGTLIAFRVSSEDAEVLGREFAPIFEPVNLVGLPNHHIYLRLMIDTQVSDPFSAKTIRLTT